MLMPVDAPRYMTLEDQAHRYQFLENRACVFYIIITLKIYYVP